MSDPTVVDGVLKRTSPSSIETLARCETAWHAHYVLGAPEQVHPTTAFGQRLGQHAHTELENLMSRGVAPTGPFARALLPYVPAILPGLLVETATTGLSAAGVPVKGRVDWTHGYLPTRPIVADWKSRKDLGKYQKTEAELRKDIQMNAYARWAIEHYPEAQSIDVAHLYVETKRHVKKDAEGRLYVFDPGYAPTIDRLLLNFSIDETKTFWSTVVEPIVERMKAVAATPKGQQHTLGRPADMSARDSACQMFGGCSYKSICPHSPMNKLRARMAVNALQPNPESAPMSLADLLKQHSAVPAVPAPAAPPPPTDGITPPDMGSRTNPPPPVAVVVAEIPAGARVIEAVPVMVEHTVSSASTPETKHSHLYDQSDGKCACGRSKPGRKAKSPSADNAAPAVLIAAAETIIDAAFPPAPLTPEQVKWRTETQYTLSADTAPAPLDMALRLYINASTTSPATDLTKYAASAAAAIAEAVGAKDPRFVEKNSPLGFGAWKGALSEYVRAAPPAGRCVIYTRGCELAEVVAEALAPIATEVIRG